MAEDTLIVPYPSFLEFTTAAKLIVDKIRGQSTAGWYVLSNAGWVVQGFGMSYIPQEKLALLTKSKSKKMSEDQLANELEQAITACQSESVLVGAEDADQKARVAALPWEIIIPMVFELILAWLRRRP